MVPSAEFIVMRRPIRIGCDDLDRLLTYPDARYLSGCALPIRMRVTYPEVRNLSRTCRCAGRGWHRNTVNGVLNPLSRG